MDTRNEGITIIDTMNLPSDEKKINLQQMYTAYNSKYAMCGEHALLFLHLLLTSNPMLLKALRLGISPSVLRTVSSRFGLPGLMVSGGMWGYDKWKNRSVNDD